MSEEITTATETPKVVMTRDEMRAKILGATPSGIEASLNGVPVELREPSMDVVLDFQQSEGNNRKRMAAILIINYVYVPGTHEPVFEEADVDGILALPFNADMQKIQNEIMKMMGVTVTTEDKSKAPT